MQAFAVFILVTWMLLPVLAYVAAKHRGATRLVASCTAVSGIFGLAAVLLWPGAPRRQPSRAAPPARYVPRHVRRPVPDSYSGIHQA